MPIPTQTYEAILEQYSAAMRWMESLGIGLSPGRTAHYARVIQHWTDAYRTASEEEGRQIFPSFVSSMFEVFDFVSIHKAFASVPVHQLTSIIQKLQAAVNGPIDAADETPDSTAARNFLFEVAMAARAHLPERGIEAILDARSDTGVRLNDKKLWIECKRVTTARKIESNVRKASSQLEGLLAGQVGAGHRGIVALDISKILNRGDKIYVARGDNELLASVDRMMNQFIQEQSEIWQHVYQRRNKKIIGTLIRFSFMATSEARNLLVHTSQWALNPRLGVSHSDDQVLRQLVATLGSDS
ncbi:hypothetical protein [Caldimonas thermodepolymerans]|jgi:hypothetical protein|uniref:hypothetical protein n=1 Tax=Caldimonas thermodepolymerans TaxID=215580 RepID=UPI0024911965|nr:hypothetical protein [Caldimonas thermodepolymerans]